MMTYPTPRATSRRRFLKTSGTMVAMIPVVNLVGCSDDQSQPASQPDEAPAQQDQTPQQAPPPQEQAAQQQSAPEPAQRPEMQKLEESDPTAQSLAYVHDAGDVDASQQSRYEEGQNCANCSLYTPDSSSEEDWGGCAIFPGKLVNANGWCSAYVPAG